MGIKPFFLTNQLSLSNYILAAFTSYGQNIYRHFLCLIACCDARRCCCKYNCITWPWNCVKQSFISASLEPSNKTQDALHIHHYSTRVEFKNKCAHHHFLTERGEARTVGNDWNQREEIKEEGLGIHSEHKHRLRLFSQAPYAAQTPPPGCKIMTQKSLRSLLVALLVSSSCKSNPCELSECEDGFITENII